MDKLGLTPDSAPSARMEAGIRLEPVLAEWYSNEREVWVKKHQMERHDDFSFMIGHVDRLVYDGIPPEDTKVCCEIAGLLEIKTTDARFAWLWGEPGTDSVPDTYNLQCQHYLAVTGLPWADIAVLIGGNDFRIYRVVRNDELIKDLIEIEVRFWENHVLKKVPPPVEGTEASKRLLKALYPKDTAGEILADDKTDKIVNEYFATTDDINRLKELQLLKRNLITEFMGGHRLLKGTGYRVSYKTNKDSKKINYEAILEEAKVPDEIIEKHTTKKPGARPFRPTKIKELQHGN